jgi:hypothetical protein
MLMDLCNLKTFYISLSFPNILGGALLRCNSAPNVVLCIITFQNGRVYSFSKLHINERNRSDFVANLLSKIVVLWNIFINVNLAPNFSKSSNMFVSVIYFNISSLIDIVHSVMISREVSLTITTLNILVELSIFQLEQNWFILWKENSQITTDWKANFFRPCSDGINALGLPWSHV